MNAPVAFRLAGPLALALTFAGHARAQCFAARLFPDKPRASEACGTRVAIWGTRAALAAPGIDPVNTDGRVLIFERTGATEWSQVAAIDTPEPGDSDYFGASVAIEGDFVAVGAPYADVGSALNGGKVYIYRRLTLFGNPVYVHDATINMPFPGVNDRLGWSVDLATIDSTLTIAIGIPRYEQGGVVDSGRVRIYTRDDDGDWIFQDTVTATTPGEQAEFGYSLDLDPSGRLVVGAYNEQHGGHSSPGAAYIFTKSGSDWGTGTRLVMPEQFVDGTDYFGTDVAIWGSWVAVGAPRNTVGKVDDAGAIYLYRRLGATSIWQYNDRLENPFPNQLDLLGDAIAMRAGLLVAGDPSSGDLVRYWRLNDSGDWVFQLSSFVLPDAAPPGNHEFGADVALTSDGESLLVGDDRDSGSGAAYVFATATNPASSCAGSLFDGVPQVEDGGVYYACNNYSSTDGAACISSNSDVWYQFTAPCNGILGLSTCGTHDMGGQDTGIDTVISVHSGCPGSISNMLACNNTASGGNWPDACGLFGDLGAERDASLKLSVESGQNYRIRVASASSTGPSGLFVLRTSFTCCLVDWDGNGTVNSTDVSSFINDWFDDQASGTLVTDFDHNGVVNSTDVSNFINEWFEGCEV